MILVHICYCRIIYVLLLCFNLDFCAGVPLTPSNVLAVCRKVKKFWSLASWLSIPSSKQKEIKITFSDTIDQIKEAMKYWIDTDPLASWRRLITQLDRVEEIELANSIRSYAEPLPGKYSVTSL